MTPPGEFGAACDLLASAVEDGIRTEVVEAAAGAAQLAPALERLREMLRGNRLKTRHGVIDLSRVVAACDRRTRQEGFHVCHDWDGRADAVNPDTIPVDVLNYVIARRGGDPIDRPVLGMLLDYHLFYLLALLSLRAWDDGDADANFGRLDGLLAALQGPGGSGQRFVADAATLLLIASSHYELDDRGYDLLLAKVRTLNDVHRHAIAMGHAACLGSHLRFGFEATYARDIEAMRADNVVDYPWLCFSLATLLDELGASEGSVSDSDRQRAIEGVLNGLSGDPELFSGPLPAILSTSANDRARVVETVGRHREALLDGCETFWPADAVYSPLSLFFNFSHNALKGMVVDALLWGEPGALALNDLLTGLPRGGETSDQRTRLATTLMGYARANPDRIRGRLMPVIVYDPQAGRRGLGAVRRMLEA